ncbi:uncharacterized protein LOC142661384 [Rhinoderma darwinii]|uniref:uncharacterized protein LOC142661384 n=1 Tax=Rhinoderma darwinii TaxID=43563 RepID=UPI003F670C81
MASISVEKLIILVQHKPCLWNKRLEEYADRNLKDLAWQEVCSEVHPEWEKATNVQKKRMVEYVKTRWNTCRDQFKRELNDKGKSGDGRQKKRPYLYTKQLSFLLDVMQVGPTKDNLEAEDSDATQIEEADVGLGIARSTSTPVPAENTAEDNPVCATEPEDEIIPRGKRRRSANKGPTCTEPRQAVDLRVLEHLEKRATETEEGTFCRALSNILKRVPIERQIRCQTALMEVVEIFATHPDPREIHHAIEFHRRGCDGSTFRSVPPAPAATAQTSQQPPYQASMPLFSEDRPGYGMPGPSQQQYRHMQQGEAVPRPHHDPAPSQSFYNL